jgi:3-polyprenyl-4-hydroxybenzoate decarboxylase
MNEKKQAVLVVTGSVAAIKTSDLIAALRNNGLDVKVLLTRAPEQWKWVSVKQAEDASGQPVLTHADGIDIKEEALRAAQIILVAPASADFISRIAHGTSPLARSIQDAQRRGCPLMLAPAMNFKMWEHPATQRNCDALYRSGAVVLGPVRGPMACGDEGFGRMIDVKEMAAGVLAASKAVPHVALSYYETARIETINQKEKCSNPSRSFEGRERILVALGGKSVPCPELENLANALKQAKITTDYMLDPDWKELAGSLERVTQQAAITEHYQLPELDGMEHIKLPERARGVFFPFIDDDFAKAMLRGEADTLCLSAYLASKTPIITTKECLQKLSPGLASSLRADGVGVIDDIGKLRFTRTRNGKEKELCPTRI